MGSELPYIMEEFPELKKDFDAHNPFTGNLLDGHEKNGELHFLIDPIADIQPYDNVLEPGDWYTVEGDIYDFNNWKYLGNW